MSSKTPREVADKWAKRLKGASAEMRAGVERVTEAPSSKAIAKQEKMLQNLIEAIESGRWAEALAEYGLTDWKKDMLEKGVGRVAGGVDASMDKQVKFFNWLMDRVDSGKSKIEGMPDLTLEDNIQRMVTYVQHMAEEKYKKSR